LRRVVGLMRPFWVRVTMAFLLGVTMLVITSFIPLVTRTIIDDGLTKRIPGVLGREVVLLMGLAVVRWVVGGCGATSPGGSAPTSSTTCATAWPATC
jgi:ABC-type multidrug transport system fused ATPase/permease subunit